MVCILLDIVFRYMKGRVKYEQVNAIVDSFNQAIEGKYRLLHTARSKKSEAVKKQAHALKLQETKDTKGNIKLQETQDTKGNIIIIR